ncbi:MAG: hypothetical protein IJG50_03500 [Clostridia bacterium]|nr:hypothetical protein [Clostridia bacterium]
MAKGIIYLMTSVVPGLVKIGKTGSSNFEQRMNYIEHHGYRNVTGFKREFAIEVEDYDEKEIMLHTIFAKSRVSDTELFALDVNIAVQLLSSFDGKVVFPKTESKDEIFDTATDNSKSKLIPNGTYTFEKKKKSDDKVVHAAAVINNSNWVLLKGSVLGIAEDEGVPRKAKAVRAALSLDNKGTLLEDFELGDCSPSHAGTVVMNQSNTGWTDWKNAEGQPVDVYRQQKG